MKKGRMTLKDQVYDSIYHDIISGYYKETDIITEGDLIRKYEVSKSPVREALIALCNENVLRSLPRLGYQLVTVSRKDVLDILEYRILVESYVLEKAIVNAKEKDYRYLEELAEKAKKTTDINESMQFNEEFHLCLCGLADNEHLTKMLEITMKKCNRYSAQHILWSWERGREGMPSYHREIVLAMEAGDLELAKKMLLEDLKPLKEDF